MAIHRHNRASPSPFTETARLSIPLKIAGLTQSVEVHANVSGVQTDLATLGRVVDGDMVTNLPLVTRNYTQIAVLSQGGSGGVFNAGELGSGGMPLSQISGSADGIFVHGARSYDNNYELDGISVNDVQGSGSSSGGIPIPNPDLIQEFKVQTGLFLICKSVLVQPTRAQRSKPLSRNLSRPRPLSRRLCRTVRELPQRFMLSRPFFAPPGFNSTL